MAASEVEELEETEEAQRALDALHAKHEALNDDPGLGVEGNASNVAPIHSVAGHKGLQHIAAFKAVFSACPPLASQLPICAIQSSIALPSRLIAGARVNKATAEEQRIKESFQKLEAELVETDEELSALEAKLSIVRTHACVCTACFDL